MKTYEILFNAPGTHSTPAIKDYLHARIDKIGKEYANIERCEVILQKAQHKNAKCEVKVRLFVPRHVYTLTANKSDFGNAIKTAFDNLDQQMNELKNRTLDKAIFI